MIGVVALVLVAAPSPLLTAQQPDSGGAFLRLLGLYRQDQLAGIRALAAAPERDLEAQLKVCRGTPPIAINLVLRSNQPSISTRAAAPPVCQRRDFLTAAMLFTDTAGGIINADHERAGRLVRSGAQLLKGLWEDYPDHTETESRFIPRWFAYSTRFLLSQRYLDPATRLVDEGLSIFPKSAELFVARGIVFETPVVWAVENLDRAVPFNTFPPAARAHGSTPFKAAVNQYLQALANEPDHFGATLRMAWINVRDNDGRAGETAALALQRAANDDERYLAQLVLGAVAERKEDLEAAAAAYSRGWQLGPEYQAACAGLAAVYTRSGNGSNANRTALKCMAGTADDENYDPWLSLLFGLPDRLESERLHREARQP